MTVKTEPMTRTLEVPGATLTYDVRRGSDDATPLFMIGGPMGAAGFTTLASHFADRTVITYDPRGSERSPKSDPMEPSPPDVHAEDLHRIIQELGGRPVDLFGSSGGAVFGLALVAKHPEDIRTLVAHEPPLASALPDRENAMAVARAIHETYQRSGWGSGMARFIQVVSHRGEFPDGFAEQPAPDPVMFGMPAEDDGSRTDPMLGSHIVVATHYEPDFEALRKSPTRIVMAAGAESEGEMANRGAYAVGKKLGTEVVVFPSDHAGFLGGEYGQTGKPDEFAAQLRGVLAESEKGEPS
jgi:pimeloyl-ACP methyl ester carboxylesterase